MRAQLRIVSSTMKQPMLYAKPCRRGRETEGSGGVSVARSLLIFGCTESRLIVGLRIFSSLYALRRIRGPALSAPPWL
jgi:hypothetical protein